MLLDLFLLLDLFWDLFYTFEFILVVGFILWFVLRCTFALFATISYDVEFDNLIIILFFSNLFATYSFIFCYDKSNIVFFVTIKL